MGIEFYKFFISSGYYPFFKCISRNVFLFSEDTLKKEEKSKPKARRRKEIIKVSVEINEIEKNSKENQ